MSIAAMATILFSGCKKDKQPTADCASQTFPSTTGTASVQILNYTTISGDYTTINAAAGDVLSIAIQVTKGSGNRPQKLRLYQTDCETAKGDIVSLAGQQGAEDGGTRLDLRNTDAAQIKQVLYTVPSGYSTYYVNIEVDESGSAYTYKRIKLNISGSGLIDTWTGVQLGAQADCGPSRMSSGTGQIYSACDAAANMQYIDITYAWNTNGYLCSNPERFANPGPLQLGNTNPSNCGDTNGGTDSLASTGGGSSTYFAVSNISTSQFDAITSSSSLDTLSLGTTQYVSFSTTGGIYKFQNARGKKGLIKVTGYVSGNGACPNSGPPTPAYVVVSIKVSR